MTVFTSLREPDFGTSSLLFSSAIVLIYIANLILSILSVLYTKSKAATKPHQLKPSLVFRRTQHFVYSIFLTTITSILCVFFQHFLWVTQPFLPVTQVAQVFMNCDGPGTKRSFQLLVVNTRQHDDTLSRCGGTTQFSKVSSSH